MSREPMPGSQNFIESKQVKKILKTALLANLVFKVTYERYLNFFRPTDYYTDYNIDFMENVLEIAREKIFEIQNVNQMGVRQLFQNKFVLANITFISNSFSILLRKYQLLLSFFSKPFYSYLNIYINFNLSLSFIFFLQPNFSTTNVFIFLCPSIFIYCLLSLCSKEQELLNPMWPTYMYVCTGKR